MAKKKDQPDHLTRLAKKYGVDDWKKTKSDLVGRQFIEAMCHELRAELSGRPLPEEKKLANRSKCHACGSILFIWARSCRLCSVCGETQGSCG